MHVTKANVTKAKRAEAKAAKAVDERINRIYVRNCSGIQIDIMDISKVFKVGREAVSKHPEMSVYRQRKGIAARQGAPR